MAYNYSYYPYVNPTTAYPNNIYQVPAVQPQQVSYVQQPSGVSAGIIWVDGEVGAKAYQLPAGLPANSPVALWDTNDTVIWLKSMNPMGMPNPLQKLKYTVEENKQPELLPQGQSNTSQFVTKEEFERMKQEIEDILTSPNKRGD